MEGCCGSEFVFRRLVGKGADVAFVVAVWVCEWVGCVSGVEDLNWSGGMRDEDWDWNIGWLDMHEHGGKMKTNV
jgi:hypothetical protein